MNDYQMSWIDDGILLMERFGTMTSENFKRGTLDRVRFADKAGVSKYVLILDYSQAKVHATAFNARLNAWSANLDPRLVHTVVISENVLVRTAANLIRSVVGANIEFCKTREEAVEQARAAHARLLSPPSSA